MVCFRERRRTEGEFDGRGSLALAVDAVDRRLNRKYAHPARNRKNAQRIPMAHLPPVVTGFKLNLSILCKGLRKMLVFVYRRKFILDGNRHAPWGCL